MQIKEIIKRNVLRKILTPIVDNFLLNLDFLVQRNTFIRKKAHKYMFLWDAREFVGTNGISGDYYEFGVNKCRTFIKAMKILPPYVKHYHGFDSFKGLPKFEKGDDHPNWSPGLMNPGRDANYFKKYLIKQGINETFFTLVEGFFKETLPSYNPPRKANIIFIDCDIVSSLKTVLEFIPRVLQDGTLVYFDDYFSYRGNPNTGQQKAFAEFRSRQKDFQFSEYNNYPPFAKAFIASKKS